MSNAYMDHHNSHPQQHQDLGQYPGEFGPIPTSHPLNVGGEGLVPGLLDARMLMQRDTGNVVMGQSGHSMPPLSGADPNSIHLGGGHQGGMLQLLAGGVSHEDTEGDTDYGGSGSHTVLDYIQQAHQQPEEHHAHVSLYQEQPSSNGTAMHEVMHEPFVHQQMQCESDVVGMPLGEDGGEGAPSPSSKK
jgi:hypothetical protein